MIHSKLKKMVFALGILISPIYLQAQENSALKLSVSELFDLVKKNHPTLNPNSAIEKKEYFSILISNCVAVENNKR